MRKNFLININDSTIIKQLFLMLWICCHSGVWPGFAILAESRHQCMTYCWKNFPAFISHWKYCRNFFSSAKSSFCSRNWSNFIFLFWCFDIFHRIQNAGCLRLTFDSRVSYLKGWSNQLFLSDMIFSRVHATLYVTMSVRRLVGWLVGLSVGNALFFSAFFGQF